MQINEAFEDAIGQDSVKRTLSVFIDSFQQTNRLPFINLTTQKGGGKTFFARKFREALKRRDGSRPPMLEINGKTIKNARSFFEQVYPMWTAHRAFLFIDEGHNLPADLQQMFLSVLNIDKSPHRTVEFEGVPYDFNFEEISFCMATTDQQKLAEPLRDRLRDIAFEEYTDDQLYEIFENNLDNNVEVDSVVKDNIVSVFRGNPRDAVVKAEDAKTYCVASNIKKITAPLWNQICRAMGINDFGLSNSELQIIKALGQRGSMTLNALASVTGYQKAAIQRDYEQILIRKNLMKIDVKRELTKNGLELFRTW